MANWLQELLEMEIDVVWRALYCVGFYGNFTPCRMLCIWHIVAPFWCTRLTNYVVHCIFVGVAVGGGWQALVAYINLGCYYIFGLPLGYLLGYKAILGVMVKHFNSICTFKLFALKKLYYKCHNISFVIVSKNRIGPIISFYFP